MSHGIFDAAAQEHLAERGPLAARMRPRSLEEVVGQEELVGKGAPLRCLIEADKLSSAIFWGPPGTGKTTLALIVAGSTRRHFLAMSAVAAGVKDVRDAIQGARRRLGELGQGTILFLDEVHRFNRAQQDALLPAVEDGTLVLIGATTENPFFELNAPLMSRSTLFCLRPLCEEDLVVLLRRALAREGAQAEEEALAILAERAGGDGRAALGALEVAIALARGRASQTVTSKDAQAAMGTRALRYGRDEHYDVISAFIKSVRGSDPDAGLYWLARMIESGEDPRFIARRLLILASEDVGLADPMALVVADAAARAVDLVGLPEAQLNLAQATIHLALAPKSNSVAAALGRARADVAAVPNAPVPAHLRDAHYRGAAVLGHGAGYLYPHDAPSGWARQAYRPEEVVGQAAAGRPRPYYIAGSDGAEPGLAARLADLWGPPGEPP